MADHTRRILRNWQIRPSASGSGAYQTVSTQSYTNFYGAGTLVGLVDKWAVYGIVSVLLVRPSTGSAGMRLPFTLYRMPPPDQVGLVVGSISEQVGTQEQLVNVLLDGTNFVIQARLISNDYGTGIINVTLDAIFTGGTGPNNVDD